MGNLSINEVRAKLLLACPYYGSAAMSLKLVETPGLGTFAVDKYWRLYYDPAMLQAWTNQECVAVMEHELGHPLREHSRRQEGREPRKWNRAGDRELNDGIQGLPKGCLHPSDINQPDGETAEFYFDHDTDTDQPSPGFGGDGCGSGAGGEAGAWEQAPDGSCMSPLEQGAVIRQTAEAVRQYGNAPGHMRRWADEILSPPRIPWSKLLPAAIRAAVAQGTPQRYRFPSRRDTGSIIMPRLISGRPSAALVVDTSGSITDQDLALAITIIRNATKHADLAVYACDTEAVRVPRLAPGCMVGGGGTDMMAGVRTALENRPKPHAIVIITDCYSPWSADPPEVPVVILTANPAQAPAWAKVITIEGGF